MRKSENNKDNNVSNRILSSSVNVSSISRVSGVSGVSPLFVTPIITCKEHARGRMAMTLYQAYKLQRSFSFQVATIEVEKSKAKESKESENEYANENVNDKIRGMIGCRCDSGVTEQDKINDLDRQITVASLNKGSQRSMKSFEIPTIRNGNNSNNSEKNDCGGGGDDMVKKFKQQGVGTDS